MTDGENRNSSYFFENTQQTEPPIISSTHPETSLKRISVEIVGQFRVAELSIRLKNFATREVDNTVYRASGLAFYQGNVNDGKTTLFFLLSLKITLLSESVAPTPMPPPYSTTA